MKAIRILYHLVAFTIFIFQAQQSLNKYFQHPIVIQESWTNVNTIEKPHLKVCFRSYFDYGRASEYGYDMHSKYLAGIIPNSTRSTWLGISQNLTFQEINKILFSERNFTKISMNQPSKLIFEFNKGFCLKTNGIDEEMLVTTSDKNLRIYIVHTSTDSRIISEKTLHSTTTLGKTSKISFDYKVYEIILEVHDNTIHDGTKCVDYRNQNDTYGDCNYKALKNHIYSSYGCYPPWMSDETEYKLCEIGIKSKSIGENLLNQMWKNINMLTDRRKIDLMRQCLPHCYQIKTKLIEKVNYPFISNNASLIITNAEENIKVFKAVYTFDIFTLTVELGSALGLWLGKVLVLI